MNTSIQELILIWLRDESINNAYAKESLLLRQLKCQFYEIKKCFTQLISMFSYHSYTVIICI